MKVVILAGGFGTRISEESHLVPKPMIEIGEKPILWHIMKYYSSYGFNEFIICAGYKQYVIKEYFSNYYLHNSDITFDFSGNREDLIVHNNHAEPWKVTIVDTGLNTMTGGRIKRVKDYIGDEPFLLTYGDGVADVDINGLLSNHQESDNLVTISAIQPGGRFGVLDIDNQKIINFQEKVKEDGGWINGGFMVVEPEIFNYIEGDQTVFEKEPLVELAKSNKLGAYQHFDFWQCMDTMRDKLLLEELWSTNNAPWKVWK